MASVPPFKRIQLENYTDADKALRRYIMQMNQFMEPMYNALQNGITIGQNVAARLLDLTITAGASASDNTSEIEDVRNPQLVLVGKVVDTAGGYEPPGGAVFASWVYVNGNIRITSITGLTSGNVYRVTLAIFY